MIHGGNYLASAAEAARRDEGDRPEQRGIHHFYPGGYAFSEGIYFAKGADGRLANGLTTVAIELEDTRCNNGGFGCLAGSHRMGRPPPIELSSHMNTGVVAGCLHRVAARAGDAIIVSTRGLSPCLSASAASSPESAPVCACKQFTEATDALYAAVDLCSSHADYTFLPVHGGNRTVWRPYIAGDRPPDPRDVPV